MNSPINSTSYREVWGLNGCKLFSHFCSKPHIMAMNCLIGAALTIYHFFRGVDKTKKNVGLHRGKRRGKKKRNHENHWREKRKVKKKNKKISNSKNAVERVIWSSGLLIANFALKSCHFFSWWFYHEFIKVRRWWHSRGEFDLNTPKKTVILSDFIYKVIAYIKMFLVSN